MVPAAELMKSAPFCCAEASGSALGSFNMLDVCSTAVPASLHPLPPTASDQALSSFRLQRSLSSTSTKRCAVLCFADSSCSALSSLNLLDVCGLHQEGWQRFQGTPGAGTSTLLPAFLLGSASSAAARGSTDSMAHCIPGFGPTLKQQALREAPHCNPDSPQTGDSSAASLSAGHAAASAAGGSPLAAWSAATSAAARTPQGPAAWSRGPNKSLPASDSSRMLAPEPAAPHSFPFIHAASLPTNLSLFTSTALGTPPPAAGSQAPPSLLSYPPLLGPETPLDVSLGTGDCFPGAAAPSSYAWSAEGLFMAPGNEYLPGAAAFVPYPAHVSSPVDRATFH